MNDLPRQYCLQCLASPWTTTAVIVPALGANVLGFSIQRADWQLPVHGLEPVDVGTFLGKPTSFGMPLLGPTPGRVGRSQSGNFCFAGRQYRVNAPRHGFFRQRSWKVVAESSQSVTCRLVADQQVAEAFGSFPFRFEVDYTVTVGDRVLECRLAVRSTSAKPQPFGVGWHPYLHSLQSPVVTIPAKKYWKLHDEPEATPTGELGPTEEKADFRPGRLIQPGEHFDDIFTELAVADGASAVTASTFVSVVVVPRNGACEKVAVRRSVALPQVSPEANFVPLRQMQLYTPPGREAICLEPLSCPPDAINLGIEGLALGPGEDRAFAIQLAIDVG